MSRTPTHDQREKIEQWGIPVPTTKMACSMLLAYIFQDKKKVKIGQRIRKVKELHKTFKGARVKVTDKNSSHYGRFGRVACLCIRSLNKRQELQRKHGTTNPSLYVLRIELEGDDDIAIVLAPSRVRVYNRGDQLTIPFE